MNQNQNQIHPALRQNALSSPAKTKQPSHSEGTSSVYSLIQPSPVGSYQRVESPGYYPPGQRIQDSPDDNSPEEHATDASELKRPRACEACRQLKVKCEPDEKATTGSCKRCSRAGRQCVVTIPSRKRQKKTDSRVAELEKKIDALTATLAAKAGVNNGGAGAGTDSGNDTGTGTTTDAVLTLDPAITHQRPMQQQSSVDPNRWQHQASQSSRNQSSAASITTTTTTTTAPKRKRSDGFGYVVDEFHNAPTSTIKSPPPIPQFHAVYSDSKQRPEFEDVPYVDVIDRNIIDAKTAYQCFDRYTNEMCRHLPIVVFTPDQTAEEVRRSRPILFLAVLAVGSGTIRPDLQSKLTGETKRILGDRIIYNGEKSMELVQTIHIMTVFYQPPDRFEELNFNQLVHIAAVMAMDIGLGKRSKKGPYPVWKGHLEKSQSSIDLNSAEARRCWLGCYYMCTNSAMSLRRPLLIRWSPYTEECLTILMTAGDALPSDKWLCHLVKAQHIGENIGVEFSMDDPAYVLSLTDPKTQRHLKAFEQNLADWHSSGGEMMHSPVMKHTEAIVNLYMHEIAMHRNHNIDDFRPPFMANPAEEPPDPDSITPPYIESITECLHSAHKAFEAFLSMDFPTLRALPTHFFVRNSYATVALIKLYSAIATKGSKFGTIFEISELKVAFYLDRLIRTLQQAGEGGMSKVATKFFMIFTMLRNWHLKQVENLASDSKNSDVNQQPDIVKQDSHVYRSGSVPPPSEASKTWSTQTGGSADDKSQSQRPHPGLQMLSDAAMGPFRSIPPPASSASWLSPTHMGQMPSMTGNETMGILGQHSNLMTGAHGLPAEPWIMGSFTSDDFMAIGLNDDWANFGLGQDGAWVV